MTPSSALRTTWVAIAALVLSTAAVIAGVGDPIQGVAVGLEGDPRSIVIAHGATNDKGEFTFANVKPGKYMIVLDSKGLAAALKRLDPKGLPATITIVVTVQPVGDSKPSAIVARYQGGGSSAGEFKSIELMVPAAPRGTTELGRIIFVGATVKL